MLETLNRLISFLSFFSEIKIWLTSKGYRQGVFWVLLLILVSCFNDVLMCHLGSNLSLVMVTFFRFFFSFVSAAPFVLNRKRIHYLKTNFAQMHLARGVIGAAALGLCCWSVNVMPLSENTTLMFTQPLFFLVLASFFLKESIDSFRWLATVFGFLGIVIIMHPGLETLRIEALIPLSAAVLFAIITLLAKKMVETEHPLSLLFYFGLVTTAIALPFAVYYWQTPSLSELGYLAALGMGANFIQLCIFRAFKATDASAVTPVFYAEIIISAFFGFAFFGQVPTLSVLLGALLIASSTFAISWWETRREKKQPV
ncbi:MAG: hypothetical protein C0432_04420 [Candidatus Puniceispirillum sp.]|nr:hypothetical protein [Candidatus Pelagibacter sp.]MBA4283520.1 hypothetical protein [Candidatus Puniceispirillum sp.]